MTGSGPENWTRATLRERVESISSPLARACRQGGRVDVRVVRAVLVLDPFPEPLGGMGKPWASSHAGILIQGFVQVLRTEERHMAMVEGEGARACRGGSPRCIIR